MNQQKRGTAGKAVPLFDWVRSEGEALIEEGQAERAGAGVGADDTADLAHKGLVPAQILLQVGLDGLHLAGGEGVTGQRVGAGAMPPSSSIFLNRAT